MEYQTGNNDKYQSSSLYQSNPSIENKFLDEVLEDKIKSLQETIKQIEAQIERRKKIKESNTYRIMTDSCAANSELLNLPEWIFQAFDKKRLVLEQQLFRLKKEERDEDTALWKDIQLLHKDLAEAKKEYQTMLSKIQSLIPKKLYSLFGLVKKEKVESKGPENDPEFDKMVKSVLMRMP